MLILAAVVLCSTLYATTLLVASTLLPQMQGSMAATPDEIAWTTTFNILATAIVTPTTGFLVGRFGRKRVLLVAVIGSTVATWLCGQAESLETLVLWRILQGGIGAPVVPLANAIVLDSFPRRQAGLVSSIFGMTVVLGPVIGPVFGGMLAETYNWRWAFYMIVPAGAWRRPRSPSSCRATGRASACRWTGSASWRSPPPSPACSWSSPAGSGWTGWRAPRSSPRLGIAALAFYVFLAHSLTTDRPFLNLRLLLDRNYALGLVLVRSTGW